MIKHVVLFKLKEYPTNQEKLAAIDMLKLELEALEVKIPFIRHTEVGINYTLQAESYDICLIMHFDTIEDVQAYTIHPEHQKVVTLIRQHRTDKAAVDFEFNV